MTTYPSGYGTALVSLERLEEMHRPKMHPEYADRLFAFLKAQGGQVGIGSGWREQNPPNTPGFAPPGRSFHESQQFTGGPLAYAAVDLVCRNPGKVHRAPWVSECPQQGSEWARQTGVHINVGTPGNSGYESWHMQPVELDGYGTWENAGKPDLRYGYLDPVEPDPPPVVEPEPEPEPPPPPPPTWRPPTPPSDLKPNPGGHVSTSYEYVQGGRRLIDTRDEPGFHVDAGVVVEVQLPPDLLAARAVGAEITVTAVNPLDAGFLTVWGQGDQPNVSALNYQPGVDVANTTSTQVDADGRFHVFTSGRTHLLVDLIAVRR